MVDMAGGAPWDVITSARRPVNRPFLSPDSRLLAFRAAMPEAVMVAALSPSHATVVEHDWVQLVPPESDVRPCGWSPDGTLLYFVSSRDGTRCLYAQRIERSTGRPQGAPFAVRHFHGTRNVWAGNSGVLSTGPGDAIRGGFFLYDIGTYASNVWTMLIP
jgi:WD40 repeat protein